MICQSKQLKCWRKFLCQRRRNLHLYKNLISDLYFKQFLVGAVHCLPGILAPIRIMWTAVKTEQQALAMSPGKSFSRVQCWMRFAMFMGSGMSTAAKDARASSSWPTERGRETSTTHRGTASFIPIRCCLTSVFKVVTVSFRSKCLVFIYPWAPRGFYK